MSVLRFFVAAFFKESYLFVEIFFAIGIHFLQQDQCIVSPDQIRGELAHTDFVNLLSAVKCVISSLEIFAFEKHLF
jgi:hypothetical protein